MNLRFATLFAATCLASVPAMAEEFYVELGRTGSESDAKSMWAELKDKYKFLEEYDVFPNQILQSDGTFTYRVQAGPMIEKSEAQKVCNKLFRRNVSCFVIEGFDPKNTQTFSNQASTQQVQGMVQKQDFVLPWMSAPVAPPPAVAESAPPQKTEETKEAPVDASDVKAKVDVAEAIPVPLSSNEDTQVTVEAPIEVAGVADNAPPIEVKPEVIKQTGWVSVQPFLDAGRAGEYWMKLRSQVPSPLRRLESKVIQPVVSGDVPKVVLALGPFESEQDANQFCRDYVPSSTYLECGFSTQPPDGDEVGGKPSRVPASAKNIAGDEYSLYWVEVLSESSQDGALEKWERIRTDNDDLLADVRSQITTSLASPGRYAVKIGPLKSKTKAGDLCDALKKRRITCKLSTL